MTTLNPAWACALHLKADATLTALVPAGSIEIDPGPETTLPYIAIVPRGGADGAAFLTAPRLSIIVYSEPDQPETCEAVHDRLRTLFHDRANYPLGSVTSYIKCVISKRTSAPDMERETAQGAWSSQAFYEFSLVS